MRPWRLIPLLCAMLLVLLIAACARENQLQGGNATTVRPPQPGEELRPEVPRTSVPNETPAVVPGTDTSAIYRSFLNASTFIRTPPQGLAIGDEAHPLLFNTTIGKLTPILTRNDLGLLAVPMPYYRGRPLRAESFVRFDFGNNTTGVLRSVRDEDTQQVRPELFFEEDKPMFEIAYFLYDGAFPVLEGETITFFGKKYTITQAYNTTITLQAQDGSQELVLTNRSSLRVNGDAMARTLVDVDPWHFAIRYFAPDVDEDGLRLLPGESLRSKLKPQEQLLSPAFDIIFDGIEQSPNDTVLLRSTGSRVSLEYHDPAGVAQRFRLAERNGTGLIWGEAGHELHVKECAGDFCIAGGERFIVINPDGISAAFEFLDVSEKPDTLALRDVSTNERHVVKLANTTMTQGRLPIYEGTFRLGPVVHVIRVLHNESVRGSTRIAVDYDGDGWISGEEVPIPLLHDHLLRFKEKNGTRWLEFISPGDIRIPEEIIKTRMVVRGADVLLGTNLTLFQLDDEDDYQAMSGRGVVVTLKRSDDGELGRDLEIAYPRDFRAGLVRIRG